FRACLTLYLHRHHRRRRLADGAALAAEFYFFEFSVGIEVNSEMDFVTTGGVIAVNQDVGVRERPEISRAPGMIEDDFLIELFEFGAHAKKRAASRRMSTMRSISSVVL